MRRLAHIFHRNEVDVQYCSQRKSSVAFHFLIARGFREQRRAQIIILHCIRVILNIYFRHFSVVYYGRLQNAVARRIRAVISHERHERKDIVRIVPQFELRLKFPLNE